MKREQDTIVLMVPLQFYYHLRKTQFVPQRKIVHVQAPNDLWLSTIIKKETEWTII